MELSSLKKIGLTHDQILTYVHLLENGILTPPGKAQELAQITDFIATRTS